MARRHIVDAWVALTPSDEFVPDSNVTDASQVSRRIHHLPLGLPPRENTMEAAAVT